MRGLTIRAGMVAGLAVLATAGSASAATLKVTKTSDPAPGACTNNDCSLREAVIRANSTGASDRIVLRKRAYTLGLVGNDDTAAAGDLDVLAGSGRLTIDGKGAGKTTIDGNDIDRILNVAPGARLSIRALTLRDGNTLSAGGALENEGSTAISRSTVRSNTAGSIGGGISNRLEGRLTLNRSRLLGNDGGFEGGAITNYNTASATLTRVVVSGNQASRGAGLYTNNEATFAVRRSTISGNVASDDGGGLFLQNDAQTRIKASTISKNTAPDGGGAAFIQNDALLVMVNSTVSGNRADQGGGIYANNWPDITISFSTIAKNTAATTGGAIYDQTFAGNPMRPPPFLSFRGTIVAKNSSPGADNCAFDPIADPVSFESLGSNLDDENTCLFTRGSDQRNANAKLRKLAKNGGPTKTHALKPSSDAFNAAKKKGCPNRDQRGVKRPQLKRCDSGSYELKVRGPIAIPTQD